METITKEEYLKKLKTKIKRTKVVVSSWYTGHDMSSKVKDLNLSLVEVDNKKWLDITIKQVEVCHELHNVNHHFLYRPFAECGADVKDCKYLADDHYSTNYLMTTNNYDGWRTHFRESMWSVSKALKNIHCGEFDKLV